MHTVTAVAFIRRRAGAPGVRPYRVWWLQDRVEVVRACPLMPSPARAAMLAALAGLAAACGAGVPAQVIACAFGLGAVRALWWRHRARRLRRLGARPGPWVWAIDAEAAACTARIRAAVPLPGDQPRRTPSMRIQSPSCSQRSWSNHGA